LGCSYHSALTEQYGNWPWAPPDEGGLGDKRYRFCLTSVSQPKSRCVGFARRRLGRGGRIIFDRTWPHPDTQLSQADLTSLESSIETYDPTSSVSNQLTHFRPKTPSCDGDATNAGGDCEEDCGSAEFDEDGNLIPVVILDSLAEFIDEKELFAEMTPGASTSDQKGFENHQDQLSEMQSQHVAENCVRGHPTKESLEHYSLNASFVMDGDVTLNPTSQKTLLSSSNCCSGPASAWPTKPHNSINPTHKQQTPKPLDSESAQFAVSAVLSASEVSGMLNALPDSSVHITNKGYLGVISEHVL